ncbi:hypothetical protein THAOC_19076, partial [Thalassiosira oceanica]
EGGGVRVRRRRRMGSLAGERQQGRPRRPGTRRPPRTSLSRPTASLVPLPATLPSTAPGRMPGREGRQGGSSGGGEGAAATRVVADCIPRDDEADLDGEGCFAAANDCPGTRAGTGTDLNGGRALELVTITAPHEAGQNAAGGGEHKRGRPPPPSRERMR